METIWKITRQEAGLSQAQAAALLYISPPQLSKIENEKRAPTAELVLRMSAVYRKPALVSRFCADFCPFHISDGLQTAAVSDPQSLSSDVDKAVQNLQQLGGQLVSILEDGRIDPEERNALLSMRGALAEVSQQAKLLKLWAQQSQVELPPEAQSAAEQPMNAHTAEAIGTVYASARRRAGFSNYRDAAQTMGMDADRLSNIETSQSVPRPEEILQLSECYCAPELRAFYCSYQCEIGRQHRPLSGNQASISLAMLSTLYHVGHIREDLRHLLADGQITADETAVFHTLVSRLNNLIFAADSLLAWLEQQS